MILIASHNLLVVEVITVSLDELKGTIIVTEEPGDSIVDKGFEEDKVFVSLSCCLCLLREEPGFARGGINKNKNIVVAFVINVVIDRDSDILVYISYRGTLRTARVQPAYSPRTAR